MKGISMRFLVLLLAFALPARADDCFSGLAKQVSYDNGKTITIIQRHGEDVTYTSPYLGGNDVVSKTHLILFPKQVRFPDRFLEYLWDTPLPKISALVPGYHFDVAGKMTADKDPARTYQITGDVLPEEEVKLGKCSYKTVVIASKTFVGGTEVIDSTINLSPDLLVVLRSQSSDVATGKHSAYAAVKVQ